MFKNTSLSIENYAKGKFINKTRLNTYSIINRNNIVDLELISELNDYNQENIHRKGRQRDSCWISNKTLHGGLFIGFGGDRGSSAGGGYISLALSASGGRGSRVSVIYPLEA